MSVFWSSCTLFWLQREIILAPQEVWIRLQKPGPPWVKMKTAFMWLHQVFVKSPQQGRGMARKQAAHLNAAVGAH